MPREPHRFDSSRSRRDLHADRRTDRPPHARGPHAPASHHGDGAPARGAPTRWYTRETAATFCWSPPTVAQIALPRGCSICRQTLQWNFRSGGSAEREPRPSYNRPMLVMSACGRSSTQTTATATRATNSRQPGPSPSWPSLPPDHERSAYGSVWRSCRLTAWHG